MHNAMKEKKAEEERWGPKKGRNGGQIKEWLSLHVVFFITRLFEAWARGSVAHQIEARLLCELATSVAVETDYENGFRGSLGSLFSTPALT